MTQTITQQTYGKVHPLHNKVGTVVHVEPPELLVIEADVAVLMHTDGVPRKRQTVNVCFLRPLHGVEMFLELL